MENQTSDIYQFQTQGAIADSSNARNKVLGESSIYTYSAPQQVVVSSNPHNTIDGTVPVAEFLPPTIATGTDNSALPFKFKTPDKTFVDSVGTGNGRKNRPKFGQIIP